MEVCAKLENFLNDEEIISLPEAIKAKLIKSITNINELITELRSENLELKGVLEREQFNYEKEVNSSKQQLQQVTESCSKFKSQISQLEENLNSVQKQWRDLQKSHDSSMLEFQSMKRNNELLSQEKRNLVDQLDKRREEVEKLNENIKSLLDQVTAANETKFASIASAEEAKLKESNLQHHVNRLEQEKELLNGQIADLNAELNQKNSEIHTLKRETYSTLLELRTQVEDKADEILVAIKRVDSYKEQVEEKDLRIEALAEKIQLLNQSHSKAEEQFNLELAAQSKLINLHKNTSEDNQKRVQELLSAFNEAQKLLKQANESSDDADKHCHDVEKKCQSQLEDKNAEISQLREELKKANRGIGQEALEKMFPLAAATSKVLHSGMTLTDLYSEYTQLQDELQQQKNTNTNLTRELKQIIAEIEEKTPIINQRMQEYDKLNDTISSLTSQLAKAVSDSEKTLNERNDVKRMCNLLGRENNRFKSQIADLNRQVQYLLKEVEETRGNRIKERRSPAKVFEEEVSSTDDITAAKVISRHLVTFQDIEEIQLKNQQLLAALKDLSLQHEEMEKKVSSEITSKFEKEIALLSSQLEDLQKKRTMQLERMETIIRQRDMYRVLLTSQGISESLLGNVESSLPKSAQFTSDPQLKEAKGAIHQLQFEFNNYKKEKSENEKLLTDQVDNMRTEISDLKVENAKLIFQRDYSDERMKILQSNIEAVKKECDSYKDKNRQHSSMITKHQLTINNLRQDVMHAQENLSKANVTIQNLTAERDLLKGVETRLLQEKESVLREQQHQSRMMSNLQAVQNNLERIESETKRNLQYQVEKYEKESAILKTKLENANEEYRAAVQVWEKQKKDLQAKVDLEVERNRKVHDDLVDSYSKIHLLNQKLASKAPTPERSSGPVPQSPGKQPSIAEVKLLKEQLYETQSKLKAVEDKLALKNKSSEQYLNNCKDLEFRVKELDEINKQLKESMENSLDTNGEVRKSLEKNLEEMEKQNNKLLGENLKLTQNVDSRVAELQQKLKELSKSTDNYKNQALAAATTAEQARGDCQHQIKLMQGVQSKYERELIQHAEDLKTLFALKEEHQKCSLNIEKLVLAKNTSEQKLQESKDSWSRQEETFRSETEALKTKISELETCNQNMHHQLELMGTQMAALQSKNWEETPYSAIQSDLKDTQHLLQVIQFIKKEKEIASTQYDVAQSENVRLGLKIDQLNNELNATRAELRDVTGNMQAKAVSEAQHAELLKKIEMMNLLSESNNLLRMEKESLSLAKTKIESELQEMEEKLQPLVEREKELQQQIEMFSVENIALKNEVKNWQSRTNQLLEQSHRIGPQEYKNMVREMEELKSQKSRLSEELHRKQAEVSKMNVEKISQKKELESMANELKCKVQEITKAREANETLDKTLFQIRKIGRKYKAQFDELSVAHDALISKQSATESSSQEQAIQEMQKKFEESDKAVKELSNEINKQKKCVEEANKTAESVSIKAMEKEDKAKKLLAQFRQKYSQLNSQRESLLEEKIKLSKEIEDLKKQASCLMTNQDVEKLKTESNTKISRLEKELKAANDQRISERECMQKQYEELLLKVSQQKQTHKSQIVGLGERTSGTGAEPLTANIKPLTSPSTSGTASGLRHSPHPHATSGGSRPTPTASIRPMAIGTATPAAQSQTRMATVLPTTATPPHSEDDTVSVVTHTPVVSVAAVQPTPATATVAPNSSAVTVSPVISELSTIPAQEEVQPEVVQSSHVPSASVAVAPTTALVPPRVDVAEVSADFTAADSPAPTTSVIVSPPATQTQIVPPTVKRPRDEGSPGMTDTTDHKRIRMVSEGSQTNQQHPTSVVTPTNIAGVPAAVARPITQTITPASEQPSTSGAQLEVSDAAHSESSPAAETELIGDSTAREPSAEEKEQAIEWEAQEAKNDDEFEGEGMDEEGGFAEIEDVEQMQGIDTQRSPIDEDMAETEEPPEDNEEMNDQPTPTATDIDILDNTSEMDADSNSLQCAPTDQVMAPPAFPPALEVPSLAIDSAMVPSSRSGTPIIPSRMVERPQQISRQHPTPFIIPGQGSNFEEGDDSIVPSTPTLYVPRRADGFAEAVSSPHVPQVPRFLFSSSESSPTQQGLSQLVSEGALSVDDTRMDLSQFDEGNRTVPSTPVQVSPPTEDTVPDVGPSNLESEPTCEIVIPTIKVELVEEEASSSAQNVEVFEGESSEGSSSKSTSDSDKSLGQEKESSAEKEDNGTVDSQIVADTEKPEDLTSNLDTESKADTSKTLPPARKPIVWKKASEPITATATSETSTPSILPTPSPSTSPPGMATRGRGSRARRMRYATTPSSYGRGRGDNSNVWTSGGRRGQRATRRRTMY